LEIVKGILRGVHLTRLAKLKKEYPDINFDQEIETFKETTLFSHPKQTSNSASPQLTAAKTKT
jgi:hypothetical protein